MSRDKELAELETISVDAYFDHEEEDFTPWLVNNIDELKELIDLPLEVIEREATVGRFRADILAENPETGRTIVIENQFGQTDHKHLGQSLVYSAGKEADVVVWIAEDFTDEHISVFRWLNNRTDSDVALFAIEVSLHQIGNSPYALEFTAVERPDEWSNRIQEETMSETDRLYSKFWNSFIERTKERDLARFAGSPSDNPSYRISIGYSDIYLRPTARLKSSGKLVQMIRFTEPESTFAELNQQEFEEALLQSLSKIETDFFDKDIVSSLNWIDAGEDEDYDKITIERVVDAPEDESNWGEYHDWLIDASLLFENALKTKLE
jgi:hypothetical protein